MGVALLGATLYMVRPDVAVELAEEFFVSGPAVRCPTCGWIEGKREITPGTFEYTLHMNDGSVSLFRETLPTKWHLGERLVVIEGISPLD